MISNDDLELIVNKWSFYDKVKYYKNIGDETKYHELVLTEINKRINENEMSSAWILAHRSGFSDIREQIKEKAYLQSLGDTNAIYIAEIEGFSEEKIATVLS